MISARRAPPLPPISGGRLSDAAELISATRPERANEIGKKVRSKVESLKDQCPWIGGVRGLGAMIGVIIVDPETGAPDKKRTSRIHKYALEHGLVMITAGSDGNIIRTLMPLTIKDDILDQSFDILLQAIVNA